MDSGADDGVVGVDVVVVVVDGDDDVVAGSLS